MQMHPRRYERMLVILLCVCVGIMCFEQASLYYLMPFIQPALHLTNTQVGLVVGVYCVIFAISSLLTSVLADALGKYRIVLVVMTAALSLGSVLSALANSFATLLLARAVMGVLEGPMFPITQSIIALESPAQRRGINMGIVGSLGTNAFGYFIAPLVLVRLGSLYGWRTGFLVVVAPGLICALLAALYLREPISRATAAPATADTQSAWSRLAEALSYRNVWLCAILCSCYVAYNTLGFTFMPLFYVDVRHFSTQQMSLLMGIVGIAAMLSSVVLPLAADRVGRKPVLVVASLLSVLSPLAALLVGGPLILLALVPLIGWALAGAGSLFMGTIPSESVPTRSISTAMGFIVGFGVLCGGLAGPTAAGWSADRWGLRAPLLLQFACAIAAALVALAMRETRPEKPSDAVPAHKTPLSL
jgi:predicted MFS family arabinose efflux permease